jgi:peptidyl-prolyl cis-trans isomerase B (cyclophilin B)
MRKLILLPLLLFASCTSETEPETTQVNAGSNSAVENASADPLNADANAATLAEDDSPNAAQAPPAKTVSDEELAEVMANQAVTSGQQPLIPAGGVQKPAYEPKRTPAFGFQVGGPISDAQLSEYYVDMTLSIDGDEVGTMSFEMWPQFAPGTVRNFLRYCDEGFYDGLGYHRIIRDFMIQGGDPSGDGSGEGPHGNIIAEFQKPGEEARKHGYGVLSMARSPGQPNSASSQFFLCCAETPQVWNLDGEYSSFGRMTKGVEVLEAAASVPVGGAQRSSPMRIVTMTKVEVKKGEVPKVETPIERPAPELNGEPEFVSVQHILISFEGATRNVAKKPRTRAEADEIVADLMRRIEAGEDFNALVKEFSDDNFLPTDEQPSVYGMSNTGVQNVERSRAEFALQKEAQTLQEQYRARINNKAMTTQEAQKEFNSWVQTKLAELDVQFGETGMPRGQMAPAFGDVGFKLKVGEVGLAEPHEDKSTFGFHIIKRLK